jgi:hypothetical protein
MQERSTYTVKFVAAVCNGEKLNKMVLFSGKQFKVIST